MRIVSVEEMRALEAAAIGSGVSEAQLQFRAAHAAADAVAARWAAGEVVALIGPGNNGRDGFLAVCDLQARGWSGSVFLTPRHAVTDEELRQFLGRGGRALWHADAAGELPLESALAHADVVLDALLGIGAKGAPRAPLEGLIAGLNRYRAGQRTRPHVVAIDVPSGVDADTGEIATTAVVADVTVVLGGAKRGLLTPGAASHTGELNFSDIGLPDGPPAAPELITAASIRDLVPRRAPDAHKGTHGRLLVVAGSERYVGAAYLVCAAAARAGAGLVALAAPAWLKTTVAARLAEVVYVPLPDAGPSGDPEGCAAIIGDALPGFDALAIGPGLSMEGGTRDCVERVLRRRSAVSVPAVVDADGINALAQSPGWPTWIGDGVVLTPHLGELGRLAGPLPAASPWATVGQLVAAWPVTLLLKGPYTTIGSDGRVWVHARPNPALATAGTGDVLTGILGGLLARGLSPSDAARLATWVHGEAAAQVTASTGGLIASDLLDRIPALVTR